ncbi:MAG: pyridoxamine 5'-phosphate oxidase family protein, partial [Rhodococcus sp. (in: high G+C Gram-positive bacteria)]
EASVKMRTGGPVDDDADVATGGVWAGVVPIVESVGSAQRADDVEPHLSEPDHVVALCHR